MRHIKAIWAYRYFIISSILTEFRSRFARSKLGGLWMILNPLAQVAIYVLILSAVLAAKLPGINNQYAYAIYLMAGTLAWSLFSEILGRSLNIFIDNGNLIKKIAFPKIALPMIIIGNALINNFFLFFAILVVFGLLGHSPTVLILWLPLLTVLTISIAIGLGLILGILNVFMRDVGQVMPIILQFWFWLTPIVYVADILPQKYQTLLLMNPMSGIVAAYQNVLVYSKPIDSIMLLYPLSIALVSLCLALFMYLQANEEMADVL